MLDVVHFADCLDGMADLPTDSVDMVLTDPPYGLTHAPWDTPLDLPRFWAHLRRIVKPRGAIVVMASQPFTTTLIASNIKAFRYTWVWNKRKAGNFLAGKHRPMKVHEDVCVFSYQAHNYYPIMTPREQTRHSRNYAKSELFGTYDELVRTYDHRYPTSIIDASNANNHGKINPTQKPVPLFDYLIRTYTRPGGVVLDPCMGAYTTAVACVDSGRHWIGYENDAEQYARGAERLRLHREATRPDGQCGMAEGMR